MNHYALAALAEAHRSELHRDAARRGMRLAARMAPSRQVRHRRFRAWPLRRPATGTLA